MYNRLCNALLMASILLLVQCWRPYQLHIQNVSCHHRAEAITYFNCKVMRYKNAERLSLEIELARPLRSCRLSLLLQLQRPNQNDFVLTNISSFEGCDLLAGKGVFKMMSILRNEIAKYAALTRRCPLDAGTKFSLQNFTINPDNFPPYMPDTKVRGYATLRMLGDEPDAEISINGSIEARNRGKHN